MSHAAHALAKRPRHIINAASQGRRADAAGRGRTVDDLSLAATASPVQLAAFDHAVGAVHVAVAEANHDLFGDVIPRGVVQLKAALQEARSDEEIQAQAAQGIQGAGHALPELERVQAAFGRHDLSGLRAHTDAQAAAASQAIGAKAYASGGHVAFAGRPDLHTVAHEAAHFVQQRAGVQLAGGVGRSGDAYERHADQVADAVTAGRDAEGLLDTMAGPGRGRATELVQRKEAAGPKLTSAHETSIEVEIAIPIYGPIKFVGKLAGTLAHQTQGSKKTTEVELVASGAIVADLIVAKAQVGLEGKVKFTMNGHQNPATVLKSGFSEIAAWHLARDFSSKLVDARNNAAAAIGKARKKSNELMNVLLVQAAQGSVGPEIGGFMNLTISLNVELAAALSALGVKEQKDLPFVAVLGKKIGELLAEETKLRNAKTPAPAMGAVLKGKLVAMQGLVDEGLQSGWKAISHAIAFATAPKNRSEIQFEGALALKVGVGATLRPTAGVEVEAAGALRAKDGSGAAFEQDVVPAFVFATKFTIGEMEVQLAADCKAKEVELAFSITAKKSMIPPEAAPHTLMQVLGGVRGIALPGGVASAASLKKAALEVRTKVAKIVGDALAAANDPKTALARRTKTTNYAAGTSLEVKLKFPADQLKPSGITVKVFPAQAIASTEGTFGKLSNKAAKGTVKDGMSFEVKWGE